LAIEFSKQFPDLTGLLNRMQHHQLPDGLGQRPASFPVDAMGLATRESSSKVLNALAKNMPWLVGGSADLYPSTKTRLTFEGAGDFEARETTGDAIFTSASASMPWVPL
jgi:transketolase